MWGGLECTVARVGDTYLDQTLLNGHENRPEDLDAFAALGIRAIRYPVLWERIAPGDLGEADWRWTDERLGRLRELGLRPIVTLLHHGSGPRHTDLTRAEARRLRPARGRALPVARPLHAGQRAADHGAVQRALRPLVPARPRPSHVPALPCQPGGGRAACHPGDPRGQPRGPAGPDRGLGPRLQHPSPRLPGGAREPPALAQPRPAARARG